MEIPQEAPDSFLKDNLIDLQSKSLKVIAPFSGAIGYVWLVLLVWPQSLAQAPTSAWVGCGLLVSSTIISSILRSRYLRIATSLLVWGTLSAVACAVLAFRSSTVAYLFIPPIIFASVLLEQIEMVFMTVVSCLFVVAIGVQGSDMPWQSADVLLPVTVIVLVAAAAWLSARNLYVALAWAWNGYERAYWHQQEANERRAELRRALKALDEATHRLSRTNYTLAMARDQAEEARRLKQQFAQSISHELRTPLNLIVGFTESMAQSPAHYGAPLPQAYLRDLSTVHRNARHLQDLVSDVLDLSRIEVAQVGLLPEEVDPGELVSAAVSTARSLVEARGLALHVQIEPELPRLWIDPIRVRQILFNLLNNAARFTDEGSVTVAVHRQDEEVVFAVTDTGVGIAPEDIPRVFEAFVQLDSSTKRRHGGAGLGLTISKRFVELHGGRIWAESQVGKGSSFRFSLPVSRREPAASPDWRSRHTSPRERSEDILLAVTQSPSAAVLLNRSVRGVRTVAVQDLEQARQAVQRLAPQAVLIDTASKTLAPNALSELASSWQLDVPFMTCPLPGEEPLRQELAADGYLIKPVSRQSLWNILRQFGEEVDHVLVVDDDRDFVRLMSRMLDDPLRRYQVRRAYSGQQALQMIQQRPPDLVLLDLILPDINGDQVIDRLRSNPASQHIPVVIVSAHDEMANVGAVSGSMQVTRAGGLMPGEVMEWIQHVIDSATSSPRAARSGDRQPDSLAQSNNGN